MVWTELPSTDKPITSSLTSKEQTILYLATKGCHPFGKKRVEQAYTILQNVSLLLDKMEAELVYLKNNEKGRKGYKSGTNEGMDGLVVGDVHVETDVDRMVAPGSRLYRLCVDDVIAFFAENFDVNHLSKLVDKESGVVETKVGDAPLRMIYTVPPPGLEVPEEYKRELEAKGIIRGKTIPSVKDNTMKGISHNQAQVEMTERAPERSPKYIYDPALPVSEQEESAAESGPLDEDDRLAMRHDFFSFRTHNRTIAVAKNVEHGPVEVTPREAVKGGEEQFRLLRGMGKRPGTSSDASSRSVSAPSTPNKRQSITPIQNSTTTTPKKRGRPSTRRQV